VTPAALWVPSTLPRLGQATSTGEARHGRSTSVRDPAAANGSLGPCLIRRLADSQPGVHELILTARGSSLGDLRVEVAATSALSEPGLK
jgi:hypothetical protein